MNEPILFVLLSWYNPLIENPHRRHDSSAEPARDWPLALFISSKHLHFGSISTKISLNKFSLQSVRCSRETRTSTHKLYVRNKIFPLIRLTLLKTLTDKMLDAFETVIMSLREIHLRSLEKFFPKDDFVLIRQLVGSFICELIVGDRFVAIVKQMTVLMFDLSHDFLSIEKDTMHPH